LFHLKQLENPKVIIPFKVPNDKNYQEYQNNDTFVEQKHRTMLRISIFALTFIFITSCSNNETNNTSAEKPNETEIDSVENTAIEKHPEDPKFGQAAKFLAGIEGESNSFLKEIEKTDAWKSYQVSLNDIWQRTEKKLPVMRDWSSKEMKDVNQNGGTLFYPFSGPDFLHADIFFPEHENVVMIGLEPIGTYPDLIQKDKNGKTELYLNGVRKSLHAILGMSFFRTIAMADDFKGEVDGTLPVLMQFLVRTGNEVLFQERVAIQQNGELTTDMSKAVDSTYIGNKFYFRKEGQDKVKTLTYFAVNLQNSPYVSRGGLIAKGLETRTDLVAYIKQIGITSTYLKSASYLMHRPTFSIIRNLILSESENVLQDDSGIPVQYFDQAKWDLTFYGTFSAPISLFSERGQPDLKEIYSKKELPVKPLPFGIGYQYHPGTSNLMKARKK